MQVVGNCPQCGAPIWSEGQGFFSNKAPAITYSCECRLAKTPVPKSEGHVVYEVADVEYSRGGARL